MDITHEKDDEGLPIGRCEECGDRQETHICPRCDLDKCDVCYGDYISTGPCNACLEDYPDEFIEIYPDFYKELF